MTIEILHGDCLQVMPTLDADSFSAAVTDAPYHLTSIVKRFGAENAAPAKSNGATGVYARSSKGFMSKTWDGGDVAFRPETWAAVYRVLKPGGHLLAFGGTRTFHRLACAIEDAGFEIRDTIMWIYGSGFPKSLDVSKQLDRAAGAAREVVGRYISPDGRDRLSEPGAIVDQNNWGGDSTGFRTVPDKWYVTAPATEAAREWQGWGTALKPACEPICVARKPLGEGTVAANVLRHGTGALNIDASRVATGETVGWNGNARRKPMNGDQRKGASLGLYEPGERHNANPITARWPANVCHDGSPEVLDAFARFGERSGQAAAVNGNEPSSKTNNIYGQFNWRPPTEPRGDTGTAARFFYTAKAGADERLDSKHPTVKPVALMEWLVRLVAPPNGRVLDPFAGTGSTLVACDRLGFDALGIEQDAQTVADAHEKLRRMRARRMIGGVTDRTANSENQLRLFA